jgi:hypothetical protein
VRPADGRCRASRPHLDGAGFARRPPPWDHPAAGPGPRPLREDAIATVAQSKKTLFNLNNGREVITVNGRKDAIDRAKELSARTRRPVSVERQDGRVKMQFSNGGLQTYRMETGRS